MPKKVFRAVYAMNYLMQAAFCLLCPAGLLIAGGWLLTRYCNAGRWVMIVAIVLGVLTGFWSMISFLLSSAHAIDPTSAQGGQEHNDRSKKQ